jgi:hypothetical protein
MARWSRTNAQVAGSREVTAIAATLGGVVRAARRGRRWPLGTLARKVGISTNRLSELERGLGTRAPLETWIALGVALERPLAIAFSRPLTPQIGGRGAGHLEIQEHILRLAGSTGRPGTFEVPTRPDDPTRSTDVGIRDSPHWARILVECWNTFGDLGRQSARRAARSRKPRPRGLRTGSPPSGSSGPRRRIERSWHAIPPSLMLPSPGRAASGSRR